MQLERIQRTDYHNVEVRRALYNIVSSALHSHPPGVGGRFPGGFWLAVAKALNAQGITGSAGSFGHYWQNHSDELEKEFNRPPPPPGLPARSRPGRAGAAARRRAAATAV